MILENKTEERLAYDIKAAAEIMKVYCEKYIEDNNAISTLLVQAEYIVEMAKALCKKY